jgi:uncharacterized iron-regulated protein
MFAFSSLISLVLFLQLPTSPTGSAATAVRLIHGTTGEDVPFNVLIDELRRRDVVVLGEEHDNTPGHRYCAEIIAALQRVRPDLAISMEQFERDTQGVVNDYLSGRISESEFLKHSRPWKNYPADYKPQIELAKLNKLDVIAGNIPRPVASKYVSSENPISAFKPRMTSAPLDRYWDLFKETMKGHPGMTGGPPVEGMYRAQCAKDDAMAESIAEYLEQRPHRKPLVVHRCGNFHCDYGLGTVARLLQRSPLLQVSIVSMAGVPDVAKPDLTKIMRKAHYVLLVPQPPKKPETPPTKTPAPPAKSTPATSKATATTK